MNSLSSCAISLAISAAISSFGASKTTSTPNDFVTVKLAVYFFFFSVSVFTNKLLIMYYLSQSGLIFLIIFVKSELYPIIQKFLESGRFIPLFAIPIRIFFCSSDFITNSSYVFWFWFYRPDTLRAYREETSRFYSSISFESFKSYFFY